MPYKGEHAGKTGHASFVKNADVSEFLAECAYMRHPDDSEKGILLNNFMPAPQGKALPRLLIACDGSSYCAPLHEQHFPSTQIAYVKASLAMLKTDEYKELENSASCYVDPFEAARLHKNAEAISIVLPGSNIIYKNAPDVASGFRKAVYEQLADERTNWVKGEAFTLADSLFDICKILRLADCPKCSHMPATPFEFTVKNKILRCPGCGGEIYVTDIMRIHEQLSDFGDNKAAMTRFMNVFEHLLVASLVNMLYKKNQELLSNMAFLIDGPLAIFGQPAKLHARLMRFYERIRKGMLQNGFEPPLVMGIQKNGALADHAHLIESFLAPESYAVISDEYRRKYVQNNSNDTDNFGHETYYGQDMIFKTSRGHVFAFAIPYPFEQKGSRKDFARAKIESGLYEDNLGKALEIIRAFECDLHSNSLVPVTLAHRHASISFVPGGSVLNLLARLGLGAKQ